MLLTKEVDITWNSVSKKFYMDKGYVFTKMKDSFVCDIQDVQKSSRVKVTVQCDYCGDLYETAYGDFTKCHIDNQDTCRKCRIIKRNNTNLQKYGVENPFSSEFVKEKIKQTNLEKYGCENPMQNAEITKKNRETCMQRYGVPFIMQVSKIKEKVVNTNMKKYGVNSSLRDKKVIEKRKQTCLLKYGCENSLANKEIQQKARETLAKNGTCPTSKPQLDLYNKLKEMGYNVQLNYLFGYYSLDCYVEIEDCKIDIEFDGQWWHRNKQGFDSRRNRYCLSKGLSVIRVKGNYQIPTEEQIRQSIDDIVKGKETIIELFTDWKS